MSVSSFSQRGLSDRWTAKVTTSLKQFHQTAPWEQRRAYRHIVAQLGERRAEIWSRWLRSVGKALNGQHRRSEPSSPSVPLPPERPAKLVDDIAVLRHEGARELLTAWAQLGRFALVERTCRN